MYFHVFLGLKYEELCMQVNGDFLGKVASFRILFHIYQIFQTCILLSAYYFHPRQFHKQGRSLNHLLVQTLFLIFRKETKSPHFTVLFTTSLTFADNFMLRLFL